MSKWFVEQAFNGVTAAGLIFKNGNNDIQHLLFIHFNPNKLNLLQRPLFQTIGRNMLTEKHQCRPVQGVPLLPSTNRRRLAQVTQRSSQGQVDIDNRWMDEQSPFSHFVVSTNCLVLN